MHKRNAVIIFSKTPQLTRSKEEDLFAALPWDELDGLFTAMLYDVVEQACHLNSVDVFLYRDEAELSDDFFSRFRAQVQFRNMSSQRLADQIQQAIENLYMLHYQCVVVILENNPQINSDFLQRIFEQLEYEDESVVFGPTANGKCFIVGMNSNQSLIFETEVGDPLQTENLLLEKICKSNAVVFPAELKYSVGSGSGLALLRDNLVTSVSSEKTFPHRTYEVFKLIEKKYRGRKTK